jgi:murein DD-endopeptidase MepM/ murein hydrolase activator NlpD
MADRVRPAVLLRSGCTTPAGAALALAVALIAVAGAAGARPAAATPPAVGTRWQWPLQPGPDPVVRGFDPPAQPWLPGHRGVDLAGRTGQPVHPSGRGVVSFAGTIAGMGVVTVRSGPLRTTYEPLRVSVRTGAAVTPGSVLGRLSLVGSHCAPAACLHWGLVREPDYLDPLALLGLEQVRLLPWVGSG